MKRQPWGLYAIALAIVVVGLVALGVPASTLLVGALVLACPLMMLFMHGGHGAGGQHSNHQDVDHDAHDRDAAPGRR
jgi:hypothetical protein